MIDEIHATPDDEGIQDLLAKSDVEFPDYCIMPDRHKEGVKMASALGIGKSKNACVGCGIYSCFGNSKYDKPLTDEQQTAVKQWNAQMYK